MADAQKPNVFAGWKRKVLATLAILGTVFFYIWTGAKAIMDWIGRSTLFEDAERALTMLESGLNWLFATPWWVPGLLAALLTIGLFVAFRSALNQIVAEAQPKDASDESSLRQRAQQNRELLAETLSNPTPARPKPKKPEPVFGSPRQMASEHYLSWWHVPVTVEGDGGSPNAEIRHCTVELFLPSLVGEPIQLRWRSDESPNGQQEIVLVEGVDRWVPIALRREKTSDQLDYDSFVADGLGRITGVAYLRDRLTDKFTLVGGNYKFKLRVRSGKKSWESPHFYELTVPHPEHSNGHFILSIWR